MSASCRRHIGGFSGASITLSRTRICTRFRTGEGMLRMLRHQQLSGHASRAFTTYALHFRRGLSANAHSITTVVAAQPEDKQTGEPDKVQPSAAAIADTLLIVESPVKAIKIQKYLGSNFKVSKLLKPACTASTSTHQPSIPHCFMFFVQAGIGKPRAHQRPCPKAWVCRSFSKLRDEMGCS